VLHEVGVCLEKGFHYSFLQLTAAKLPKKSEIAKSK